jgi:FlaA1/EpsC-like NDP-sugar epimerase/lipopolysaccharide/colanic/teichoic acid biosynthesis glycosyltransferase
MTVYKRGFDLVLASLALLLLWPLFLLIALLIWLEDGGPVFFRHERVGKCGRPFRMWKFRSMRAGPPGGSPLTIGPDPRITRVGGWLRELKLDELPQLFNVLTGRMTLVGPRPEVPRYVGMYTEAQREVLDFVPGITDAASLWYWNESEILGKSPDPELTYLTQILPDKIKMQLDYPKRATVWRDISLIRDTLLGMVLRFGGLVLRRLVPYRRVVIVIVNILLIIAAYRLAFDLRFDFAIPPDDVWQFWSTLPILLAIRLIAYWRYELYAGYWQHVGMEDLATLSEAMTVGSVAFAAALVLVDQLPGVPRSVLVIEWASSIFLAGGVRLGARYLQEMQRPPSFWYTRRTLVIGTGNKAERLLREVRRDLGQSLRVLGLITEASPLVERSIHGVPVVGSVDRLKHLVGAHRAEFVVIALDAPTGEEMQRVVDACVAAGVEFKTLPSLRELLQGSTPVGQLRNVRIEDLLGRDPVGLDVSAFETELRDKVVLITGGAGSIGSELARLVVRCRPKRLVLLDQAESALYFVAIELAKATPTIDVVPIICDVTDESSISQIFADHQPQYVIHAAAYKHVPMMELNVIEAVRNNVLGSLVVADAAATWGASRFVLISTDKAVNPSSVMGGTKRIAERVILGLRAFQKSATEFRAVRFGNVLGSAGSVVPLFEKQIAAGGPVTVTDPDVERYFMTITESALLVLQAATLREAAGRIAMLDMGEPVRILDLAEKLIRLAGHEPYRDIPIVFTGLRPGEKLREELMSGAESGISSTVAKIRIVMVTADDGSAVKRGLAQLLKAVRENDPAEVLAAMRELVPECVAPLRVGSGRTKPGRPGAISGQYARTMAEVHAGID